MPVFSHRSRLSVAPCWQEVLWRGIGHRMGGPHAHSRTAHRRSRIGPIFKSPTSRFPVTARSRYLNGRPRRSGSSIPKGSCWTESFQQGEGPGEFRVVASLGWVADTLWVFDFRLDRITLISPDRQLEVLSNSHSCSTGWSQPVGNSRVSAGATGGTLHQWIDGRPPVQPYRRPFRGIPRGREYLRVGLE